jgi:hypothetical protein
MSVEVVWDDAEKNIVRMIFSRQWTWEELYQSNPITDAMAASVDHKIGFLIDMCQTRDFPAGVSASKVKEAIRFTHPNSAIAVMVGNSMFVQMMVTSLVRVLGRRDDFLFAEDIDQARALIANHLQKLNGPD